MNVAVKSAGNVSLHSSLEIRISPSVVHSLATPPFIRSNPRAYKVGCFVDLRILVLLLDILNKIYIDYMYIEIYQRVLFEHCFGNMLGGFFRFGDSVAKHVTGNEIPPAILTA